MSNQFQPSHFDHTRLEEIKNRIRKRAKDNYDKRHNARSLMKLAVGQNVLIQDRQEHGIVFTKHHFHRFNFLQLHALF